MPQAGLVLDYDHSTDLAAPEGRPAPAAGWLKEFKVEHGAIFARIEWTKDAAEAVKQKKYRYVSPVFEHSKDGKVERILRAALTNNPALTELPAIAAARTRMAKKEAMGADGKSLSEIVAGLEELFPQMSHKQILEMAMGALDDDDYDAGSRVDEGGDGMAAGDDPYEYEDAEQMAARHAEEMARCASDGERTEMAKKHMVEKERFAKRVRGLEVQNHNEKMHKEERQGRLSHVIAKHPMVVQMAADLNQMRAEQAKDLATQKVDAAIREGRLIPSQREWAIAYCTSDSQGFEKFIGAQPKIIQTGTDGTFTGRIGDAPKGVTALDQREIEICANLGLESEDQLKKFAANKEKWTLKFPRPRLILDDTNSGDADNGAGQ
jgi:phage I-like protein